MSSIGLSRRRLLAGGCAAALAVCAIRARAQTQRIRLVGESRIAHRLRFQATTVGGLSGLDYDPREDLWYAISDDRSDLEPARFYTLRLPLSADALGQAELKGATALLQPGGAPFPSSREGGDVPDPEGIRFRPATGSLLWVSEGDSRRGIDPFLREAGTDGRHLREFTLPPMFRVDPGGRTGPRNNLAFEGLALQPDGHGAWVAMESALAQDGPVPAFGLAGGPCRFTLFDIATARATRQIAYLPDALPQASVPAGGFADNGVSEILMLDAQRMLVLERAYATGVGNSLRLYLIDTAQGSDTLGLPVLRPEAFQAPRKALIADFATLGLARLDNTEAMAWGPRLANGNRTLVFASDDNFNSAQVTQFLACEMLE